MQTNEVSGQGNENIPQPAPGKAIRVLVADDSENDLLMLLRALKKAGYVPTYERVWQAAAMRKALSEKTWDIVISDYEMPGFGGLEALQIARASGLDLPFILVSAVLSEETAVSAMRSGAHDFIMKRNFARLGPAIERELREAQSRVARKAAEKALRESEEQLRQSQKIDAIGRLAAGVAHDFNNILTAISGHSEMLLRQFEPGDKRRRHAEQIEKAASMAAALTRQLLTFSRKQIIQPRSMRLDPVIINLEKMLRRLIGEHIVFKTELAAGEAHIKADAGQLEQVIMNLVVNARDAMPGGGELTVATAVAAEKSDCLAHVPELHGQACVLLRVTDTGIGMTDDVKAHLFEPFFTTKPTGKGTGLGLATCFGIVKQNAGHIDVQSELQKGTSFRIYFPMCRADAEPVATTVAPSAITGGKETVLLVEDEAAVRELAVTTLRERGYTVLEAGNGEEGLNIAKGHDGKIDLVLTDVVMPVMGGKEMVDAIRKCRPGTRILFTSGYTDDAIRIQEALRPGMIFLQKPYIPTLLARTVRELLDLKVAAN